MMTPRGMRAIETLQKMSGRRAEHNQKRQHEERKSFAAKQPIKTGKTTKWPFQFMEIGDKVEIHENTNSGITVKAAIQAAHSYGKVSRRSFQCRSSKNGLSVKIERIIDPDISIEGKIKRRKNVAEKTHKNYSWPFKNMRVGETVSITPEGDITAKKIMAAAHSLGNGRKFKCRMSIDGPSVSVYRIS